MPLISANTLPGMAGEVYLYLYSKSPLPGTDLMGPFEKPFFVSREYARRCVRRGLNVQVVDPERTKTFEKKKKR